MTPLAPPARAPGLEAPAPPAPWADDLPGGGPRRHRRRTAVLVAVDVVGLLVSFALALLAESVFGPIRTTVAPAGAAVVLSLAAFVARGLYSPFPVAPVQEVRALATSLAAASVAVLAGGLTARGGSWSLVAGAAVGVLVLPMGRAAARTAFAQRPWWGCRAVVIGAGETAQTVVRALRLQPEMGLRPVAILADPADLGAAGDGAAPAAIDGVPVAGPPSLARRFADERGIEYAVVAMPEAPRERIVEVVEHHTTQFDRVLVIPDLYGLGSLWVSARDLDGTIGLELRHRLKTPWRRRAKRAVDVTAAAAGLAVLALPLALIALAVRLESAGPALFRQVRLGQGGRCFDCLKFRTMRVGADAALEARLAADPAARAEWDRFKKLRDDPRVTRVGRWLRRLSLDELPQLWNVLRGEMSLVGPRAYLPRELDDMRGLTRQILRVRPGITGLWQVSGRNALPFADRLDLDVHYVRNWSFSLDLYLLARTVPAVVFSRGAA